MFSDHSRTFYDIVYDIISAYIKIHNYYLTKSTHILHILGLDSDSLSQSQSSVLFIQLIVKIEKLNEKEQKWGPTRADSLPKLLIQLTKLSSHKYYVGYHLIP